MKNAHKQTYLESSWRKCDTRGGAQRTSFRSTRKRNVFFRSTRKRNGFFDGFWQKKCLLKIRFGKIYEQRNFFLFKSPVPRTFFFIKEFGQISCFWALSVFKSVWRRFEFCPGLGISKSLMSSGKCWQGQSILRLILHLRSTYRLRLYSWWLWITFGWSYGLASTTYPAFVQKSSQSCLVSEILKCKCSCEMRVERVYFNGAQRFLPTPLCMMLIRIFHISVPVLKAKKCLISRIFGNLLSKGQLLSS